MRNKAFTLSVLILLSVISVQADIAPGPGFRAAAIGLELITKEDVSAFRFFLLSAGGDVEEIHLAKGKGYALNAADRGGAMRFGNVYAVPVKDIPEGDGLNDIADRIEKNEQPGTVRLLRHSFREDVSVVASSPERVIYEVRIDANGNPVAVKLGEEGTSGPEFGITYILIAVAGVVLFFLLALGGFFIYRRMSRGSSA